jgi:NADH:ubiquinone oxidoreductase subunit E
MNDAALQPAAQPLGTADELRQSLRKSRHQLKGRQTEPDALAQVQALIGPRPENGHRRDLLIEHLHTLNDHYRALFERHLVALAQEMNIPMAEVFEVASFYHHFEILKDDALAAPALTIRVCDGLACDMAGAQGILARLPSLLGDDSGVRIVSAPCLGRCEHAPVASVHQSPVLHATEHAIFSLANNHRPARPGRRGLSGRAQVAHRARPAAPRLMAVNIDEGEPGTFKDRTYLERDPHRFLEGVLIAAQVVGTESVYIYLRDEYHGCRALLQTALDHLRAEPPCPLPHIELRRGAGAYICGEESAMIESIEGKRGEPRMRPPYIAQVGLFGRPTLEHNFETLYWVRDIVERGPHWFASFGRHGRKGLRSFSVSGRVKHPGVKLAPAGITVQELIDEYCGGMAGRPPAVRLPAGRCLGRHPACQPGQHPARL